MESTGKSQILHSIVTELHTMDKVKEDVATLLSTTETLQTTLKSVKCKMKYLVERCKDLDKKVDTLTEQITKKPNLQTEPTPIAAQDFAVNIVTYRSFELIGDSLMYQFALQEPYAYWYNPAKVSGLCAANHDTGTILAALQNQPERRIEKAIVLLGWDETKKPDLKQDAVIVRYAAIISLLRTKFKTSKLILCTVPPVPQLEKSADFWSILKRLNCFVWSRRNALDGVTTAPVFRNFTFEVTSSSAGKVKYSGKRKFELRSPAFTTIKEARKEGTAGNAGKVLLTEAGFRLLSEAVETGIENAQYL